MSADTQPPRRRPIRAREWEATKRASRWLAGRNVSPDHISLLGLLCGVAAGCVLAATSGLEGAAARAAWLAGAALVQLRLLANMLDGMVALETKRVSPVGELYNEVPDRVSDAATLIGLGYAAGGEAVLGFAAACVALLIAYVRAAGAAAGAAAEFCGPMAKQQRMAVVTVVAAFGGLAPAAWQPSVGGGGWGLAAAGLVVVVAGGLWTAGRRLRRVAGVLRGTRR